MKAASTLQAKHEIVLYNGASSLMLLFLGGECMAFSLRRGQHLGRWRSEDIPRCPKDWKDAAPLAQTEFETRLRSAVRVFALD